MFSLRLFKSVFPFSRITPQLYPTLFTSFTASPSLQTLSPYLQSQNLLQIYNIVKHTKLAPSAKIDLFDEIEKKLCTDNNDMEFNILANMHRDKSLLYLQMGSKAEAVVESERAVKAIQAMEQPFSLEVATLMQATASLHIQVKNYPKAQKFLKDAEHTLNLTEQQLLESSELPIESKKLLLAMLNRLMAEIMSKFCLVHMQQMHVFEARQYLARALDRWKAVEGDRKNCLDYLLTVKFQCILHVWVKEEGLAVQAAKDYLQGFQVTRETVGHRMWFMKFLVDHGVDTYADELKANIEELSKTMNEKDLSDLLIKLGVIKKPSQPQPPKPAQK